MRLRVLGVCLVVVFAGCSVTAPQTQPDTQTVVVSLTNNHDTAHAFTVTVIPPQVDGLVVTYDNGSRRVVVVGSVSELPRAALRNATSLIPIDDNTSKRQFVLEPGSGIGTMFKAIPRGATVAFFVMQQSEPRQIPRSGLTTCGEAVERTELTVTVTETGELHADTHCAR